MMEKKKKFRVPAIFHNLIFSEELPLEARLLNIIYLIGLFAVLSTLIIRALTGSNKIVLASICVLALFVLASMYAANRLSRYSLIRWITLSFVCNIFFPLVFFAMGGVRSVMVAYFVLSTVLVFFLAWGKSRIIFLLIHFSLVSLTYYLSSLPAFSRFVLDNSQINVYFDNIHTIIVLGLCIGFMISCQNRIMISEMNTADAAKEALEQRNKFLKVLNRVAENLLTPDNENLERTFMEAMDLLARCIDADRVYIWGNRKISGILKYEQLYEWLSDVGRNKTLRAATSYSYIDTIPGWNKTFSEGGIVNGPLSSLSENERRVLSPFGICSILAIPVFLQEKFWGFLSFDDCRRERVFTEDEVNLLRSGGLLLANALARKQNEILIDTRMRQQELMASISKSFISKDPIDALINESLTGMGKFLEVSRVIVAEMDTSGDRSRLVYTWISSAEWQPKPVQTGITRITMASFPLQVPGTGYITAVCCSDAASEYEGKYRVVGEIDVKAFIWAPIYVEGSFWGLISVEECAHTKNWSESDVQLVGTVSSAISGAVSRSLIDKARTAALEQAVQASQAKGAFLANMSHEMRTPMNAIIGMTAIGKKSDDLQKKDYAFQKIEDASSHLLGVINDILDMSKIEANKLELSSVTFSFEDLLQKVVNVIGFRVDERHQDLSVHIDRNIPRFIVGDDHRLVQVVTNLLSNAVKFTPDHGRIHLEAKLAGTEDGINTIQIEVSDTGIGISKEQQKKLFTSFEQADSGTSRKFGGTGLGLAISKRIVELMGGKIWIDSEIGKGSVFTFTFKARKGHGVHQSMLLPKVNIKNIRVMAVDDNDEVLEYFREIMFHFGIKCDFALSGEEALALVEKKGDYDLFFVDWKMPAMDGIELTKKIKDKSSGKSVVIMISATEWNLIEKSATEAGVDKFLTKPLFPSSIADIINECLGEYSLNEARETGEEEEAGRFKGYTMLLAEDVEINREIVITLLENTALTIECAENGREAVEKFAAAPDKFDIVFMDIQMPEKDGYEATRQIRSLPGDRAVKVPIIAMTANVFHEDVEKCFAAGMNDHVGKPFDLDNLLEKLRKFLPRR